MGHHLAATGTFEQLLTYVVFTGWLFYALGAASIFIYRRNSPDASLPYRVPGYPWTPLLFIVAAGTLVVNTLATQPGRAAVGLGIVLLGAPGLLHLALAKTSDYLKGLHSVTAIDPERVRAQFPALARVHNGRPVAYFDSPGETQDRRAVVDLRCRSRGARENDALLQGVAGLYD